MIHSIKYQLLGLALVIVIALSSLIASGLWQLSFLEKSQEKISHGYALPLNATKNLESIAKDVRYGLAGVLLDQIPTNSAQEHLKNTATEVDPLWAALKKNYVATDPDSKATMSEIEAGLAEFTKFSKKLNNAYTIADNTELREMLEYDWPRVNQKLIKPIEKLGPQLLTGMNLEEKAQSELSKMMRIAAFVIGILSIIAVLVPVFLLFRRLIRELSDTDKLLRGVAAGDLSRRAPGNGLVELRLITNSVNTMLTQFSIAVAEVRAGVENVSMASLNITQSSADLSIRTEKQASSLQSTAAAIEQLNSTVKQSSDTAKMASNLAHNASSVAKQGGKVVGRVVATMTDIQSASTQITEIISVIDGIAFQTNILALNAAVEAARAGEHGLGFAVVASEVRTLAQRSANAAREIKVLIERTVEQVDHGALLVKTAGNTMTDIVSQAQRVSELISEISAASIEQSGGIDLVNQAVVDLDEMTQQNANMVEQSATAANNLRNQAKYLTSSVGIFKLAA